MQLYLIFKLDHLEVAVKTMEKCIESVKLWTVQDDLVLSNTRPSLSISPTRSKTSVTHSFIFKIGQSTIEASKSVRNLGLKMNLNLCMSDQISRVCRILFILMIKRDYYLDKDNIMKLAHPLLKHQDSTCIIHCSSVFLCLI